MSERQGRTVAMRSVLRIGNDKFVHRTVNGIANCIELRASSVFVVLALHKKHRSPDAAHVFFDVPIAECVAQPDGVPSVERRVNAGMVTCKARS